METAHKELVATNKVEEIQPQPIETALAALHDSSSSTRIANLGPWQAPRLKEVVGASFAHFDSEAARAIPAKIDEAVATARRGHAEDTADTVALLSEGKDPDTVYNDFFRKGLRDCIAAKESQETVLEALSGVVTEVFAAARQEVARRIDTKSGTAVNDHRGRFISGVRKTTSTIDGRHESANAATESFAVAKGALTQARDELHITPDYIKVVRRLNDLANEHQEIMKRKSGIECAAASNKVSLTEAEGKIAGLRQSHSQMLGDDGDYKDMGRSITDVGIQKDLEKWGAKRATLIEQQAALGKQQVTAESDERTNERMYQQPAEVQLAMRRDIFDKIVAPLSVAVAPSTRSWIEQYRTIIAGKQQRDKASIDAYNNLPRTLTDYLDVELEFEEFARRVGDMDPTIKTSEVCKFLGYAGDLINMRLGAFSDDNSDVSTETTRFALDTTRNFVEDAFRGLAEAHTIVAQNGQAKIALDSALITAEQDLLARIRSATSLVQGVADIARQSLAVDTMSGKAITAASTVRNLHTSAYEAKAAALTDLEATRAARLKEIAALQSQRQEGVDGILETTSPVSTGEAEEYIADVVVATNGITIAAAKTAATIEATKIAESSLEDQREIRDASELELTAQTMTFFDNRQATLKALEQRKHDGDDGIEEVIGRLEKVIHVHNGFIVAAGQSELTAYGQTLLQLESVERGRRTHVSQPVGKATLLVALSNNVRRGMKAITGKW